MKIQKIGNLPASIFLARNQILVVICNIDHPIIDYQKTKLLQLKIEQYKMCVEHTLELFMKKDLDDMLGPLDCKVSQRKKIVIMFQYSHLILISAGHNAKIEPIIRDILQKLKPHQLEN